MISMQRLLVCIRKSLRRNECLVDRKIRWWSLKEGNAKVLTNKVVKEANWTSEKDLDLNLGKDE